MNRDKNGQAPSGLRRKWVEVPPWPPRDAVKIRGQYIAASTKALRANLTGDK
jgi:hypothetical protein